jgi:hypothetical protein
VARGPGLRSTVTRHQVVPRKSRHRVIPGKSRHRVVPRQVSWSEPAARSPPPSPISNRSVHSDPRRSDRCRASALKVPSSAADRAGAAPAGSTGPWASIPASLTWQSGQDFRWSPTASADVSVRLPRTYMRKVELFGWGSGEASIRTVSRTWTEVPDPVTRAIQKYAHVTLIFARLQGQMTRLLSAARIKSPIIVARERLPPERAPGCAGQWHHGRRHR